MAKKYRVKMRFKRKKEIYKKTFFALFALVLLPFLPYACSRMYSHIRSFYSGFGRGDIKSINVNFSENFLSRPLTEYLRNRIGTEFRYDDSKKIEDFIASRWPYATDVKVEFNWITGTLAVSGKFERAIALYISGDEKKYILESGKAVGGVNLGKNFLMVRASPGRLFFPPEFVAFINEFNSLKNKLNAGVLEIVYNGEGDSWLVLADGSRVIWGSFRYTSEKITRLNAVLGDALGKLRPPFNVDARYFEDGKIFVSPLSTVF